MKVFLCLCVLLVGLPPFAANADSLSLPSGYVPGQSSAFTFRLPPVTNLASYNVELLLTSPSGVAGTDFFFDTAATSPASSAYVFPSQANFFASANILPGNTHSLTLSDFGLSGVNVVANVNDAVASVVFRTSPSFNGVLSLSLREDTFQLDTPDAIPSSVPEYALARSVVAADINGAVSPVPEPSGFGLVTVAIWAGACYAGLARVRWPHGKLKRISGGCFASSR